jgi:hypothetical protein
MNEKERNKVEVVTKATFKEGKKNDCMNPRLV